MPVMLIDEICRQTIIDYTRSVPFISCPVAFGFETQLMEPESFVDFAFCVSTEGRDILTGRIDQPESATDPFIHPWWQKISRLCRLWGQGKNSSYSWIRNLWLEYKDVRGDSSSLPHMFIGMKNHSGKVSEKILFNIINAAAFSPPTFKQTETIRQCIKQMAGTGDLFQVGLSPYSSVIRLCFKFHEIRNLCFFLHNLGLAACERQTVDFLAGFAPGLQTLCLHLDIADWLLPGAGIELHIAEDPLQPADGKKWEPVLNRLVRQKLCLSSKKEALLDWYGCSYEDLGAGFGQFLTYRYLYYLKAFFITGAPPVVKAYFGFINRKAPLKRVFSKCSPGFINKKPMHSNKQAVERGISWLYDAQLASGEFKTYLSPSPLMEYSRYDSSPFVTGCLLYNLSFSEHAAAEEIRRKAKKFLLDSADKNFLWRYWTALSKKTIDPDMDDTCLISFVLQKLCGIKDIVQNKAVLLANRNQDGLFFTWLREKGGGNDVDTVVNANALLYLGQDPPCRGAVKYIKDCIRVGWEEGSYWYYLDNFSLYYAVSRAYANGITAFADIAALMVSKILTQQQPDGSFHTPLRTALALCSLKNLNYPADKKTGRANSFLLNRQTTAGFWPGEAFYRGPEYPDSNVWFGSPELTTGFCLEALAGMKRENAKKGGLPSLF